MGGKKGRELKFFQNLRGGTKAKHTMASLEKLAVHLGYPSVIALKISTKTKRESKNTAQLEITGSVISSKAVIMLLKSQLVAVGKEAANFNWDDIVIIARNLVGFCPS